MDFRMISKEKLCSHMAVKTGISNLRDRIAELECLLTRVPSSNSQAPRVQGGTGGSVDAAYISWIAEKDELQNLLSFRESETRRVERALGALTDEQRVILDRFYIHRSHNYLDLLMDELGYERRAVYYRHDDALKQFTLALYGMVQDT